MMIAVEWLKSGNIINLAAFAPRCTGRYTENRRKSANTFMNELAGLFCWSVIRTLIDILSFSEVRDSQNDRKKERKKEREMKQQTILNWTLRDVMLPLAKCTHERTPMYWHSHGPSKAVTNEIDITEQTKKNERRVKTSQKNQPTTKKCMSYRRVNQRLRRERVYARAEERERGRHCDGRVTISLYCALILLSAVFLLFLFLCFHWLLLMWCTYAPL